MEQKISPQLKFPELTEAIFNGWDHDFILKADNLLYCLSNPEKFYDLNEVHISAITCQFVNATIYLITTIEGNCKGTLVDYWEHYSST